MYVSNQSPYYDDFNETKQFYRILFRPGRAVQARELTQLQSILQKQIERFGAHIFKEGSIVQPGQIHYERNYKFVKLQSTYNSVDADNVIEDLVGDTLTGQSTGLKAIVVNQTVATGEDPPTIFVKYINAGTTGLTSQFEANEILVNSTSTISVRAAVISPCGAGTAFNISQGVVFTKGTFAYFPNSTLIVSKYSSVSSDKKIGFLITEDIIDDTEDSSLLDPAVGFSNYFAPGADRYKIDLTLEARALTFNSTIDDPNFIELMRIQSNEITFLKPTVEYNLLADTLARRTYDESGDYVVRPFALELLNHLKSGNAIRDGYLTSSDGGNDDLYVASLSRGKAYVKGYEIENVNKKYVLGSKARNFANVNSGTIATEVGNYIYITDVHSIPDITNMVQVQLYDRYTTAKSFPASGANIVGNARVRAIDYNSGTLGSTSAIYKMYLFDVNMVTGFKFEEDVKQLYYDNGTFTDFTANIVPNQVSLTGTVSTTSGSATITGSGTSFDTQLEGGDFITVGSQLFRIDSITNAISLAAVTSATATVSGVNFTLNEAAIQEGNKLFYVFELPYKIIKAVDTTNSETDYQVRRVYDFSLSAGQYTLTAGTDETFAPYSSDNYQIVIQADGSWKDLSGLVTRGGTPTGKTVTFNLSGNASLTSAAVRAITTVNKTTAAALRKSKTLNSDATLDVTTQATGTAAIISLGKADVYGLKSVSMSTTAFGTSYSSTNASDITERYTLDNGQRATFYDVGRIVLKPGKTPPTGPIRITFDYFSHGSGDYFSVDSYNDVDYKSIPSISLYGKTFNLRDCLDFRPRINDAGTGFSGTGSSQTEFLESETDFQTDFQYYLPKVDKLVLDKSGNAYIISGPSVANPPEPKTPDDAVALYILKQNAYVFNVNTDINITEIDNRRYTMRDIGRIENRVKNLEYYTTLNLLENETASLQIQDADGFDRFKNGFIVDNFSGHGVGDVTNPDYSVSIDLNKRELRPRFSQDFVRLYEFSENFLNPATLRAANSYAKVGDCLLPTYTEEALVQNSIASKDEFINPFNILTFRGVMTLTPSSDIWFDTLTLPVLNENNNGKYDTLTSFSQARVGYDSIYGGWRNYWFGEEKSETKVVDTTTNKSSVIKTTDAFAALSSARFEIVETFDTTAEGEKIVSRVVIPKMRSMDIGFNASGLKPNTVVYAFFDDVDVSNYTVLDYMSANTISQLKGAYYVANVAYNNDLITDDKGNLKGIFNYRSEDLDMPVGTKIFRLSDSPTNGLDRTTYADAVYQASGELIIKDEYTTLRPKGFPGAGNGANANVKLKVVPTYTVTGEVTASWGGGSIGLQSAVGAYLERAGFTSSDVVNVNEAGLDTVGGAVDTDTFFTAQQGFDYNAYTDAVNNQSFANMNQSIQEMATGVITGAREFITNNYDSLQQKLEVWKAAYYQSLGAGASTDAALAVARQRASEVGWHPFFIDVMEQLATDPAGSFANALLGDSPDQQTLVTRLSILAAGQAVLGVIHDGKTLVKVGP